MTLQPIDPYSPDAAAAAPPLASYQVCKEALGAVSSRRRGGLCQHGPVLMSLLPPAGQIPTFSAPALPLRLLGLPLPLPLLLPISTTVAAFAAEAVAIVQRPALDTTVTAPLPVRRVKI